MLLHCLLLDVVQLSIVITDLGKWDEKPEPAECIRKTLIEVCGDDAVVDVVGHSIHLEVDGKSANIDIDTMQITCSDQLLHHLISSVCQKMMYALTPVCSAAPSKQTI